MLRATALQFRRYFGEYQRKAKQEPVEITVRGQRKLILLSAERFDWMLAAIKRSHRTEEMPETILRAVLNAKMDKRHNHLNKLLKD